MAALVAAIGCGSSQSSSGTPPPTGLSKRVLLSNQQSSTVNLLDAKKDVFSTKTFPAPGANKIVTANGQTIVLNSTQNAITVIDNTKEIVSFTMALDDQPVDVAITSDGTIAFAAESNLGEVRFGTTADGNVSPTILHVPAARRLVMSPKGTKLLVFSDPQSATNINSIFLVDTASKAISQITSPQFDQPFTAVFGAGETQAFILNCGPQCGGTAASVVSVDFTNVQASPPGPANFSANVPVAGATAGLLSGSILYVAGTPPQPPATVPGCPLSRCGVLTAINTSSLTPVTSVPITDGVHERMAITSTARIYIGASGCTVDPGSAPNTVRGCLTIFNINTLATKFPQESAFRQNFDVTGLQPISGRSVIYVVQAGELDIFDTTADAVASNITQIDVVGKAIDAVQIDP